MVRPYFTIWQSTISASLYPAKELKKKPVSSNEI
jgi:hypothetical protein